MFSFIKGSDPSSTCPNATRTIAAVFLASLAVVSCRDWPTFPPALGLGESLSICHMSSTGGSVMEIRAAHARMHERHGDYLARLIVDKQTTLVGDGLHFTRITDAIAAARASRIARNETSAATCRMTIAVAPGVFEGTVQESADPALERFPLVIDVPDITLRGSFIMALDAGGRATGESQIPHATTLVATPGLLTVRLGGAQNFLAEPIVVVTDAPDGPGGKGTVVEGFVFQSGNSAPDAVPGGQAIYAMRGHDLVFRGNRIEGNFTEPISLRAMNGAVIENYLIGRGGSCAICIAGPGHFDITGNRLMGPGGIPGILIFATSTMPVPPMVVQEPMPTSATVTATVTNNEIRNHRQKPSGAGLRIGALGVLSSGVISSARVVATGNTIVDNTFGVMLEAAFPVANTLLKGDIDLDLDDNTIAGNCQANVYVAFARNSTGLGLTPPLQFQSRAYLRNSTFTLGLGGDVAWADAWYANPDGFGNTLIVDGEVIPNGTRVAYDANRVCAP